MRKAGRIILTGAIACVGCILTGSASGQGFPTVGVYDDTDQPNEVDFVAEGSALNLSQFKADVAVAFSNNFGGVHQCNIIGPTAGPYPLAIGISQAKTLIMTGHPSNRVGVTTSGPFSQSISEIGLWGSSRPTLTFFLTNVSLGVAHEAVVQFGLTIGSTDFFSLGQVTATATFSGGGNASASRLIGELAGLGDTFFGFAAPRGQSITSVTFTHPSGLTMPIDDVGFITAPLPVLTIARQGASQLRISWPTNAAGLALEFATGLPTPAWAADTNTPTVLGDRFTVVVDGGEGRRFYRLHGP
jgi:hypothetical protein